MTEASLGGLERRVLMTLTRLGPDAVAVELGRALESETGRSLSRGALYTTLDRLESKGLLTWRQGDSTPERGGLPRREFSVTGAGRSALRASHRELAALVRELDELLDRA